MIPYVEILPFDGDESKPSNGHSFKLIIEENVV